LGPCSGLRSGPPSGPLSSRSGCSPYRARRV
jgi:hypothetical protein